MSNIPTETQFFKGPEQWIQEPGCVCRSSGVAIVHDVTKTPMTYTAGAGGALPGLTPEETAILAGILTGLAIFLFLLLPILCCLCPFPCLCCGKGKKKGMLAAGGHRSANLARSDNGSFWTGKSWGGAGGEKVDYDNLYGVDMKLPRPWVDNGSAHFDSKMNDLHDGGWEGVDMTRDEIDAAIRAGNVGEEAIATQGVVSYAENSGGSALVHASGSGLGNDSGMYSTVERKRGAGDEIITEYTTTRRVDMHIGGMDERQAEGYYTAHYIDDPNMSKENFMKIYDSYRHQLDGN